MRSFFIDWKNRVIMKQIPAKLAVLMLVGVLVTSVGATPSFAEWDKTNYPAIQGSIPVAEASSFTKISLVDAMAAAEEAVSDSKAIYGKLSEINRATGMDTVGLLSSIGIMNPFNRKQETEADYLGMIFASLSGYDIRETVKVWERMREANKGKEPPVFMSTHPSSINRINNISEWMSEIIIKYPPIS